MIAVGGQGKLFAAKVLGEAARITGTPFRSSEIHGMAQRGGMVESSFDMQAFTDQIKKVIAVDAYVLAVKAGQPLSMNMVLFDIRAAGAADAGRWFLQWCFFLI